MNWRARLRPLPTRLPPPLGEHVGGRQRLRAGGVRRSRNEVADQALAGLPDDFAGFVLDNNRMQLRAIRRVDRVAHQLTVISDLPVTAELLREATLELGEITLFPPDEAGEIEVATNTSARKKQRLPGDPSRSR